MISNSLFAMEDIVFVKSQEDQNERYKLKPVLDKKNKKVIQNTTIKKSYPIPKPRLIRREAIWFDEMPTQ